MKLGFIGLGNMGKPMSTNLVKAGHEVTVYDLREEEIRDLVEIGARAGKSPREVAEKCDVLLTSLPTPRIVEEVLTGTDGALGGAKGSDIFIDLSTVDPMTIRRIGAAAKAEKRVSVVDAPVTGGVAGARAGSLTIMVGGDQEPVQKVWGILESLGKTIVHVGGPGAGCIVKLVNNLIAISYSIALAEGLVLGVKAGVDLDTLGRVLSTGAARGYVLDRNFPRISKGDYEATFILDLGCKDIDLAIQMGKELSVPLFLASTSYQIMECARNAGLGQEDVCAVTQFIEEVSNLRLVQSD